MDGPTLEEVGATLRAFVLRAGVRGAVAATQAGVVEVDEDGTLSVQEPDEEESRPLQLRGARALAVVPGAERIEQPFAVNAVRGEVSGGLGALEGAAESVRALARTLGAPTVVIVQLPTTEAETPLGISARTGDPLVVIVGDEQYEMAAGWPPPR